MACEHDYQPDHHCEDYLKFCCVKCGETDLRYFSELTDAEWQWLRQYFRGDDTLI